MSQVTYFRLFHGTKAAERVLKTVLLSTDGVTLDEAPNHILWAKLVDTMSKDMWGGLLKPNVSH